MKIIGLTGPSGSGKSTLCKKFEELGIPCINTDDIYHQLTSVPSPCLDEIKIKFGNEVIAKDGSLDRAALAKLVFEGENSDAKLASLNSTTHKYVWEETNKILCKYINKGKKRRSLMPLRSSHQKYLSARATSLSRYCAIKKSELKE